MPDRDQFKHVRDLTDAVAKSLQDDHDALMGAFYAATAIPADMIAPNLNGRAYPKSLLISSFQRFAKKLDELKKSDLPWPGRFQNLECAGAVAWGRDWHKPVRALDWVAPVLKPMAEWRRETRQAFGIEGSHVPFYQAEQIVHLRAGGFVEMTLIHES